MTSTDAVRYDVADGIVTLTIDDPNQNANTMNETHPTPTDAAVAPPPPHNTPAGRAPPPHTPGPPPP
ncbi:hypothetical protein, partial [Aeromicrobium sp. PE09-221]|uniref:hypothetical protein n=1 Tax=Aeromicrobium sp. PE09-221 TaxID=1898043 RepID=UPI0011244DB8